MHIEGDSGISVEGGSSTWRFSSSSFKGFAEAEGGSQLEASFCRFGEEIAKFGVTKLS